MLTVLFVSLLTLWLSSKLEMLLQLGTGLEQKFELICEVELDLVRLSGCP